MALKNQYYYLKNVYINLSTILSRDEKDILRNNSVLKNCHSGKRCFILGNGPSLNTVNFGDLKNEFVFTVNQLCRHKDFPKLNSNFHIWADPSFFNLNLDKEEDRELLNIMKNTKSMTTVPYLFVPINQIKFVKAHELDKIYKMFFFKDKLMFHEGYNKNIDLTKIIPFFGTVVQYAIAIAIYMGFSEIYLLGCDNTGLMVQIKSMLNKNDGDDYSYELSANEKRRLHSTMTNYSFELSTLAYYRVLTAYRIFNDYCSKRDIKLVNCSSQTVIDSLPREQLQNVLERNVLY